METVNEIPFLNIMKFIANKYSIEIPDNFNIFFIKNMEPNIRKFPTHIRIFKFYIYSNALLKNNEYLDIIIIYLKSMTIWKAFKKFLSINILQSVESGSKDSSFHLIKW